MEAALIEQGWPRLTIARPSMLSGEREKKRANETFLEPLFLIMVMTTFHVSVENQPLNLEWDARLTALSGKFKELKDKAAAWVSGKPAPSAA